MRPALELRYLTMSGLRRTDIGGAPWKERLSMLAKESDRAYLVALRAVGAPALAEEAVQEAFAKLVQRPIEDRGVTETQVYFFKMVRGVAIDLLRSERGRKRREAENTMGSTDAVPSTERTALDKEMAHAVRSAVAELPVNEREAISLCYEQDLSQEHAGEILGIPQQTISIRIRSGLERLRLRLAEEGFAAVTPMAVAGGLRDLGIPPAPPTLQESIQSLVSRVSRISARITHKSTRVTPPHAGLKAGVAVLALAAAAFGLWSALNQPAVEQFAPPPPDPASIAPPDDPPPPPSERDEAFHFRWNFSEGPAKDIAVLDGAWNWKKPDGEPAGFMSGEDDRWVTIVLPPRIPQRPILASARIFWRNPQDATYIDAGLLAGGVACKGITRKREPFTGKRGGTRLVEYYFVGQYLIVMIDGALERVSEYGQPYPGEKIYCRFYNAEVREIEIRSLSEDEMPAGLREPEKLFRRPSRGE